MRITKPIRVEQSYYDEIEAEALKGKRPLGSQIEILWDFWKGMQRLTDEHDAQRREYAASDVQVPRGSREDVK